MGCLSHIGIEEIKMEQKLVIGGYNLQVVVVAKIIIISIIHLSLVTSIGQWRHPPVYSVQTGTVLHSSTSASFPSPINTVRSPSQLTIQINSNVLQRCKKQISQ